MKNINKSYKQLLLTSLFLVVLATRTEGLAGVESNPPETLNQKINTLKQHIAYREERLSELTSDMLSLDVRTEKRVDTILKSITTVTDSLDSKTNVARTKQDAIVALKACAERYKDRRKSLKMETLKRNPRISRNDLFEDIDHFDNHTDTRIKQIISIVNSMQQHQDYEKWRGYDGFYLWRNDNFYHNRQEVLYTEKERKKLTNELRNDIEAVERRNREIRRILESKITPQYRTMLMEEMDKNLAKIDTREANIEKIAFPDPPKTKPVGRAQAYNIESVVGKMAHDLDRDCRIIWQTYIEINRERQALKGLRAKLAIYLAELELNNTN